MHRFLFLLPLVAACTSPRPVPDPAAPVTVEIVETDTEALLVSVSHAPDGTLWTAGTMGTWGRSSDGGKTWTMGTVAGADTLQFRDVQAFSARRAVLLSIGNGEASRVYTTSDGGASWTLRWTNREAEAFYDCMAFFDTRHGFAFSDAVGTRLPLIETRDGGVTWTAVPPGQVPEARPGEGGYASSGTCAMARGDNAWIVTNGGDGPDRVFFTPDRGSTWQVVEAPIGSDDGGRGLATLAVGENGLRAGLLGAIDGITLLRSDDAGQSWQRDGATTIEQVYGLAAVSYGRGGEAFVAVGPGGLDVQRHGGAWQHLSDVVFWGATAAGKRKAVVVGREGRVGIVTF